jgi:hypothetical protein
MSGQAAQSTKLKVETKHHVCSLACNMAGSRLLGCSIGEESRDAMNHSIRGSARCFWCAKSLQMFRVHSSFDQSCSLFSWSSSSHPPCRTLIAPSPCLPANPHEYGNICSPRCRPAPAAKNASLRIPCFTFDPGHRHLLHSLMLIPSPLFTP